MIKRYREGSFNSLYWDFCFASSGAAIAAAAGAATFNSLYWDFCFASGVKTSSGSPSRTFNSLYWDFCFASAPPLAFANFPKFQLSIPFIGIFALHRSTYMSGL